MQAQYAGWGLGCGTPDTESYMATSCGFDCPPKTPHDSSQAGQIKLRKLNSTKPNYTINY
jgi:hypothetical protein